mmetsp:Transcript_31985/g.77663  ORF Transcript_31985/g.77663 Transcript_31985/m.77663 type:complete len:245 (+) Transcript_31985:271-1005(+)
MARFRDALELACRIFRFSVVLRMAPPVSAVSKRPMVIPMASSPYSPCCDENALVFACFIMAVSSNRSFHRRIRFPPRRFLTVKSGFGSAFNTGALSGSRSFSNLCSISARNCSPVLALRVRPLSALTKSNRAASASLADTSLSAFFCICFGTDLTKSQSATTPTCRLVEALDMPARELLFCFTCPITCRLQEGILVSSAKPPTKPINLAAVDGPMSAHTEGAKPSIDISTNSINLVCTSSKLSM